MSGIWSCPACGAGNRLPMERIRNGEAANVVCGKCRQPLFPPRPLNVGHTDFEQRVMVAPLPVLVDFWAPWCGPCRMIGPELEKLAAQMVGRVIIAKVNIDENESLAARFGIRAVPTMLLVKNGQIVDSIQGAMPAPAIRQRLEAML